MRVKLLAVLMTLGLALSPMSVMAQNSDFEATKLLANKGDAEAQYSLGNMYFYGNGVDKDDVMAVKYYQLAADQGNAEAQNNLGVMYKYGMGVAKNQIMAVKYYQLAAGS
jgi:TPR repeat protein